MAPKGAWSMPTVPIAADVAIGIEKTGKVSE
jgi:hypothetical protein